MHRLMTTLAVAGVIALAGTAQAQQKPAMFDIMSPGHKEFSPLELKNAGNNPQAACHGQNISPALAWKNAPPNTKSFAIVLFDPNGNPPTGFIHWIAYGIPATKTSLKEGEANDASATDHLNGKNGAGSQTYFGPCPPAGQKAHPYAFIVMALDLPPDAMPAGLSRDDFAAAIKGHVLNRATLTRPYGD